MNDDNYPELYRNADSASVTAQRTYVCLNRLYLGSLVLGSIVSATASLNIPELRPYLFTILAIVLTIGFIILWIMRARQDEKVWFDGRAVAESVKTVTWRFMMKVLPFDEDGKAEELFIKQLKEIREARPQLAKYMDAAQDGIELHITDFMREKRAAALGARRAFYISDRLDEQRTWYTKKAKQDATSSTCWFWTVAGFQIGAVVLAVIQAASKGLGINLVPVLITFAAAFAAWVQLKRFDELAQSYNLAAQELGELRSLSSSQTTIEGFTQLIEQVENSISREHTMWCARRDVPLSRK